MTKTTPSHVSRAEFEELFQAVCNWGRWGDDDEKGTLNYIQPEHIRRAAGLVRSGRSVSMTIPINKVAGPDNPRPAAHYMVRGFDIRSDWGEPQFSADFLATEFHGDCQTHIDALCHIAIHGKLYNGKPMSAVTSRGPRFRTSPLMRTVSSAAGCCSISLACVGSSGWSREKQSPQRNWRRRRRRKAFVSSEGDIFVFRTGHHRRRLELGPWKNGYDGEGKAGLHVETIFLLHERKVAAFFPDGDGETVPSNVEGVGGPIHALQIASMGMACADSLQFEELIHVCEEERRWEFLVVAAPLRLPGGTGSLFNPIAIF